MRALGLFVAVRIPLRTTQQALFEDTDRSRRVLLCESQPVQTSTHRCTLPDADNLTVRWSLEREQRDLKKAARDVIRIAIPPHPSNSGEYPCIPMELDTNRSFGSSGFRGLFWVCW